MHERQCGLLRMQYVHLSSEDSSFSFDLSNSILVAMQRESSWYTPFQIAHGKKKKKKWEGNGDWAYLCIANDLNGHGWQGSNLHHKNDQQN